MKTNFRWQKIEERGVVGRHTWEKEAQNIDLPASFTAAVGNSRSRILCGHFNAQS